MTDDELLIAFRDHGDESAKAEIVNRHRPMMVKSLARRIGDADAAGYMADAVFNRFFASTVDLSKGSASYWILCESIEVSAGWISPSAAAHRRVFHNVDDSMEEFANGWPEGEWQRRYEAGMRKVFSQPREIDTMTAQEICDEIDTQFSDTSRSRSDTLKDMRTIANRAGAYAALPEGDDDYEDDDYDYDTEDFDDVEAA